ncbi:hypothetical protein Aperf_G00000031115 [Anoplocephala perfoliata]
MTTETTSQSPRIVIMPVDDSPHCERAFNWYLKRAHRPDDKLVLVHVIQPRFTTPHGGILVEHTVSDFSDSVNESVETGKKVLEKYATICKKLNYTYERTLRADANPGRALINVADEYYASLIVIASRGMSKARRTIMGSCSHYVIYNSGVPVLVVPPAKKSSASFTADVEQAKNE